ncbi:MAG: GTPase Era [Clostridia bacterium]|nr:GTPase Era [Clostridia bacterium]
MENFKSGFVSILGRTNVGKSTLLNALVGEKVAITTSKSQTTRTAIKAIVNRENSQIIFIDTPGIHKPKTKLGNTMLETAWGTIQNVDVTLFVVDGSKQGFGKGDRIILEKIKEAKAKTILVINKVDLLKKEDILKLIETYKDEYNFEAIIPISAEKQKNIDELLDEIEKHMPEGPMYYDVDEYTDQTGRQLVEEVIREKALKLLDEEIPHGIYVEVEKMNLRNTTKGEEIYDVEAIIYCLRDSHKGIIIGKNGAMLKRIGTYARQDLERMLQTKINLKIWVKVNNNWQDNNSIVKKFENK